MVMPSWAQVDLSKVLVGRWEGEGQGPKVRTGYRPKGRKPYKDKSEDDRTLVIGQVREQEGKWIVEGAKYGRAGERLHGVEVVLDVNGDDVVIQFDTRDDAHMKLKLTKENFLVGTRVKHKGFVPMEFKKVE